MCPIIIARSVHLSYYSGSGNNSGIPDPVGEDVLPTEMQPVQLNDFDEYLAKGNSKL